MILVKVDWEDITSTQDNLDWGDAKRFTPIKRDNVGWLIEELPDAVIIGWGNLYHDKNHIESDATKIIDKGVITKITVVGDLREYQYQVH